MLIHGFPLDHTTWNDVAASLQDDFDVILPDLRGFGESSTIESPYTLTDMADDLAALLDHLGVEQTALAGHSMGGYVALAFAKKYPQRVSGLALVASQSIADTPERKAGRYQTAAQVAEIGASVIADAMTAKLSVRATTQKILRETISRQSKSGSIGALKAMAARKDLSALLPTLDVPLILIHGDADDLISIDRAYEMNALAPQARLVKLPNVGHAPMFDAAQETAAGLRLLKG